MIDLIANKYALSSGVGRSGVGRALSSFDKALLSAGVGNYNLVRLSSILPAGAVECNIGDLLFQWQEGSLLPVAYSTISSSKPGELIVSTIGVGLPVDKSNVGVIMEYSAVGIGRVLAFPILRQMIGEAFECRGWELASIKVAGTEAIVGEDESCTTFACIAEW